MQAGVAREARVVDQIRYLVRLQEIIVLTFADIVEDIVAIARFCYDYLDCKPCILDIEPLCRYGKRGDEFGIELQYLLGPIESCKVGFELFCRLCHLSSFFSDKRLDSRPFLGLQYSHRESTEYVVDIAEPAAFCERYVDGFGFCGYTDLRFQTPAVDGDHVVQSVKYLEK